jgi:hypothetical protein
VVAALAAICLATQGHAREPKTDVTYTSECSCEGDHGESRWQAKTDPSDPPANPSLIRAATPSDAYSWPGPNLAITRKQERIPAENQWYAVTGRIVEIRAEEDGDLHLVLEDAAGQKRGRMVTEIPLEAKWCPLRTQVLSWTDVSFPFETRRGALLNLVRPHVVTVIGRVLYDVDHAGRDTRTNRRNYDPSLAVWEIHPVMQLLDVSATSTASRSPTAATAVAPAPTVAVATPPQFVTITQPITIQIPYGTTVLAPGTKLPVVSRDATAVRVRYMNDVYAIPIGSTDLR